MKHYNQNTIRASRQKQILSDLCLSRFLFACPLSLEGSMSRCKSIEGYEGKYLIYDDGRVYSQIRKNRLKGMFLKPTETHDGYFTVHLSDKRGGKQKILKVSRLVALHFIPNPENKPCVNHKDGNKEDNTFTNLEWNTVSANNYHKFRVLGDKITIRQRNRVRETVESFQEEDHQKESYQEQ